MGHAVGQDGLEAKLLEALLSRAGDGSHDRSTTPHQDERSAWGNLPPRVETELDEPPGGKIASDHVFGQMSPAQTSRDERVFRGKVDDAPGARRENAV
jgi:hypothetical protein